MATAAPAQASILDQKLKDNPPAKWGFGIFALVLVGGVIYIVTRLSIDLSPVHQASIFPYVLLGIALLIALGFEFVNGFHDTANAVATVIYTHSLEPHVAVVWSGLWNFIGVLTSSGTVAFSIVSLLPVELILKVSKGSGFSMVFALLVASVLWNLATWWRGLPVSSSHTMIGSILGVGLANQFINGRNGVDGVDWTQVTKVFEALIISPIIGFVLAALLFYGFKLVMKDPRLYEAPKGAEPPPFYIRALLVLTCTGVSFAHGSNDGQKGMGLIMLVLVGTVPTAYALNHTIDKGSVETFAAVSTQVAGAIGNYTDKNAKAQNAQQELEKFVSSHDFQPTTMVALQKMVTDIRDEAVSYGSLGSVPSNMQANVRNQMYLTSETMRLLPKYGPKMSEDDIKPLTNYKGFLDKSTKYIPSWVKVAVALALGLGTMVGWKRIVVTVGEKIGKTHLTYAQGASAELVAMVTILGADSFGMPVSTTHVLSSGVAGTMAANGSGLQMSTLRNIAIAWVFTLPAAAVLSGILFWIFNTVA
ncbi:Low-affinity inorganic phosphate transporter [Acidisarcina polymorpha]|uniref:Phosphate transporter n=1 Tax=Acidisarcina polymorpha TaxID=2211140 RepID=A0A2Z5G5W9_9BACT|nr:inorganic phosphate transporter [Acidisarcina polymorpha]AXC14025.1 Low-affinity inorganic phosphate transporter [Acidisarcina polymorpha]